MIRVTEREDEKLYWLSPEDHAAILEEIGMNPKTDRTPVYLNSKEQKAAAKLGIRLESADIFSIC